MYTWISDKNLYNSIPMSFITSIIYLFPLLFISFLIITDTVTERIKKLITATISINKSNGIFRCCAVKIRRQIYRNEITHLLRCWTSDNFLIFFVIRINNQLVHLFIVLQDISLNVLKNVNFSTATI
jgi:hypothetical protein